MWKIIWFFYGDWYPRIGGNGGSLSIAFDLWLLYLLQQRKCILLWKIERTFLFPNLFILVGKLSTFKLIFWHSKFHKVVSFSHKCAVPFFKFFSLVCRLSLITYCAISWRLFLFFVFKLTPLSKLFALYPQKFINCPMNNLSNTGMNMHQELIFERQRTFLYVNL